MRGGAAARPGGAGRRHLQRAARLRRSTGSTRSCYASSASVYGLAEAFPTLSGTTTYNNDTFYGAAKSFNEGMRAASATMYGLDYVACATSTSTGPRMDMHGLYTEVLVRWMERIATGSRR